METDYRSRLRALAASLPAEARVVGLLCAGDPAEAAALAADLAAAVASRRPGHTILVSVEGRAAALDHEVGQEGGPGLSDVFRGRRALAEVAASGRARGFIYLPTGSDPIRPDRLLASRAWARLSSSAVDRGATLLLFLPSGAGPSGIAGRLDGVVWLGESPPSGGAGGPATAEGPGRGGAGEPDPPVPVLGRLAPPGAGREGEPPAAPATPEPARRVIRRDPRPGRRRPARAADRKRKGRGAQERASSRRPAEPRGGRRLAGVLLLLAGGALTVAVFALLGSGDREPFLPQNDSLWSSPVAPPEPEAGPDSAPAPDSADPDADGRP